jgi:heat shock protein HtpX
MNTLKTIVLMGCLSALIVAMGGIFGGKTGVSIALAIALATNVASYWFSDKIALSMSGAQPVSRDEVPQLYEIVERIAANSGLPVPSIYIIPSESPNAFATGRDPSHSAVAVTEGIMRLLNWQELEGVLAHEMGHVRNRDVLLTTIAAVLASVVTWLPHLFYYVGDDDRDRPNPLVMIGMAIVAPLAASLINLAISRSREYEADATGAKLCGDPLALASALQKIDEVSRQIPLGSNPALSSLYIMPTNPMTWFNTLFSTHPPTPERIERLRAMAAHSHH